MTLRIEPLRQSHIEDAAALAARRYAALRTHVPALPPRWENADIILPMLADIASKAPGAIALRDGRLVGFLQGITLGDFRGARTALSPEWANAAEEADSRRIYDALYTHLSPQWVADGCLTHLVCQFSDDRAAIEGWHWLGFGMLAGDAVRPLAAVQGRAPRVAVRRATPNDIDDAIALADALSHHLSAPPTFLHNEPDDRAWHERWLADPAKALWLAYHEGRAVSCIGIGPAHDGACTIIQDEGTASITRAYTVESARGRGDGAATLARAIAWARAEGYIRCAVDFEPMNVLAARFWTRHFDPVAYAMVRHIDPRFGPRNKSR